MLHPSCLLNPTNSSILSTQPYLISDSFLPQKNTLDMFPLTNIKGIVELTDLLYSKKFSKIKAYSLVIKHTDSTWLEWSLLMSASLGLYQPIYFGDFPKHVSLILPFCLPTNPV